MERPVARLAKHSKRVSLPEYPTTVSLDALEASDAATDEAPAEDVVLYGVVVRHVKGASGNGWERVEFAIPASVLATLPQKRFEFDMPRIVQAQTTEYLQNIIEDRITPEYFK